MRISAFKRLKDLPDVFSLNQFCRTQNMEQETAYSTLREWGKKDLIEFAGPRSCLYYNKIKSLEVTTEMRIKALKRKYPSAILMGESVLHNSGVTTQIPYDISVAILSRPSLTKIDGFSLHKRSRGWYKKNQLFKLQQEDVDFPTYGLPTLSPEVALIDLYKDKNKKTWKPDVDDLELDDEFLSNLSLFSNEDLLPLPEELKEEISNHINNSYNVNCKKSFAF